MNIAIIGTGNVGSALAGALAKAGHRIYLGVRDPIKVEALVAEHSDQISAHTLAEAAAAATVILIAAIPAALKEITTAIGDVSDKVIIDAMNTLGPKPEPYAISTEALRAWTHSPHVVKCFNTTGFENMANPRYGDTGLDMFMAGDSQQGKTIARQLALDIGFGACYDFGGDDKVALLESFALAWINLAIFQKQGRDFGFKLLQR